MKFAACADQISSIDNCQSIIKTNHRNLMSRSTVSLQRSNPTIGCAMSSTRQRLQIHLRRYWKIELLNVFLLPTVASYLVVFVFKNQFTLALAVSLVATAWLLVIGTIALRMMQMRLDGELRYEEYWLPKLHYAQLPSLLLILVSNLLTLREAYHVFPTLLAAQYVASGFTLLATLEYINYYHRQLQHFDNAADFRRLLTGHGFRQSHLARSLANWRKHRLERARIGG